MKTAKLTIVLLAILITAGLATAPSTSTSAGDPSARYTISAGPLTYVDGGSQLTFQTFVRMDTTTGRAWALFYVTSGGSNYALPDWVPIVERFAIAAPNYAPSATPTTSKAAPSPATR